MDARARLIHALDHPTVEQARAAARALRGDVGVVKVGLELFTACGPEAVALGREQGLDVFLDLKLHDIPATVGHAVERAAALGASLLTIHAAGGRAMCSAAVQAAGTLSIVAVTVLTSLDDTDLRAMGLERSTSEQARKLAELAFEAGVRAFVCSPLEATDLRRALGSEVTLITPGVRPAGSAHGDQKRVTTPAEAIAAGADMLVVGRPIRDAADPVLAARAIVSEIAEALGRR